MNESASNKGDSSNGRDQSGHVIVFSSSIIT